MWLTLHVGTALLCTSLYVQCMLAQLVCRISIHLAQLVRVSCTFWTFSTVLREIPFPLQTFQQLSLFSDVWLKGMLAMQEVIHALETEVRYLQQELGMQIHQAEQRRLPKVQMVSCRLVVMCQCASVQAVYTHSNKCCFARSAMSPMSAHLDVTLAAWLIAAAAC